MGCGTSRELDPPALELDSDATCIMCLECVEDDADVVQVSVTDNANKSASDEDDATDSGSSDGTAAPSKVLVRQDKDGGPWINPDCGHACHLACLRGRCQAAHTGGPAERLTFGHLTCAICRSDFNITNRHAAITNQQRGAKTLEKLMKHDIATRDECTRILRKHARESPIDKIEGIDAMSEEAADALIARKIGAFRCTKCKDLFAEGIECGADHAPKQTQKLCQPCTVRASSKKDYSKCPEPLYKCDLCCSVAKYRCPDYYQCEKHHSQGAKIVEKCPGGSKCPLGVDHPQNAHVRRGFAIGCDCGRC
jgi:hypothetical protein